jgi:hypothetical protein
MIKIDAQVLESTSHWLSLNNGYSLRRARKLARRHATKFPNNSNAFGIAYDIHAMLVATREAVKASKEFATSLRLLADLYENNPTVPLPASTFHLYCSDKSQRRALLHAVGTLTKDYKALDGYIVLSGKVGSITLDTYVARNEVCERRVTGTQIVEKKIPVEFETRTETVEKVEWICNERASVL